MATVSYSKSNEKCAIIGLIFSFQFLLIAASSILGGYYSAPKFFFHNSKKLNYIGALSFFKICSHIFMIFEVKLE